MFWYSYKGLEPHLQRAHAGHTQEIAANDSREGVGDDAELGGAGFMAGLYRSPAKERTGARSPVGCDGVLLRRGHFGRRYAVFRDLGAR